MSWLGCGMTPSPSGPTFSKTKTDRKGKPLFEPRQAWRCTTKPSKLYIHLFRWPGAKFELTGVTPPVTSAYLLADRANRLAVSQADGKLTVALPDKAPDPIASVLCLETEAGVR